MLQKVCKKNSGDVKEGLGRNRAIGTGAVSLRRGARNLVRRLFAAALSLALIAGLTPVIGGFVSIEAVAEEYQETVDDPTYKTFYSVQTADVSFHCNYSYNAAYLSSDHASFRYAFTDLQSYFSSPILEMLQQVDMLRLYEGIGYYDSDYMDYIKSRCDEIRGEIREEWYDESGDPTDLPAGAYIASVADYTLMGNYEVGSTSFNLSSTENNENDKKTTGYTFPYTFKSMPEGPGSGHRPWLTYSGASVGKLKVPSQDFKKWVQANHPPTITADDFDPGGSYSGSKNSVNENYNEKYGQFSILSEVRVCIPNTVTKHANPSVSASSLTKNVGDLFATSAEKAESVSARSGNTDTLFDDFGGDYNGDVSITDNTVPVDGDGRLSRIGKYSQTFKATDMSDPPPNTSEPAVTREVTVRTTASPALAIRYATGPSTGNVYTDSWTNQSLTATVAPDGIAGSFRNAVHDASGYTAGAVGTEDTAGAAVKDYTANTSASGIDVYGVLLATDGDTELSACTAARHINIDKDDPIPDVEYDSSSGVITDKSGDALSGLDESGVLVVPHGVTAGTGDSSNYVDAGSATIPGLGNYDVWVWAKDNAGNEAHAMKIDNILRSTSEAPLIRATAGGISYSSGDWTNKSVTVAVTRNGIVDGGSNHLLLNRKDPESIEASGSLGVGASKVYDSEIDIKLFGVLSDTNDGSGSEFSGRTDDVVVRIDKTAPTASASYSMSTGKFTDASYDNGPVQSGVDTTVTTGTKVVVVEAGRAPATGDYVAISSAGLPDDDTSYDAWVIATDKAGNVSSAVQVLDGSGPVPSGDEPGEDAGDPEATPEQPPATSEQVSGDTDTDTPASPTQAGGGTGMDTPASPTQAGGDAGTNAQVLSMQPRATTVSGGDITGDVSQEIPLVVQNAGSADSTATNVTDLTASDSEKVQDAGAGRTDANGSISDTSTPYAAGQPRDNSAWALMNLLLAIAGAVMLAAMFIMLPRRRDARPGAGAALWPALSAILAAAGILLFFTTQRLSGAMAFVDKYTAIQSVIFAIALISAFFAVTRGKRVDAGERK